MLRETGQVVAVDADSVWVETIRQSTCGSCAAQSGCGHGILNRISTGRRHYIQAFSGEIQASSCAVDDRVLLSIPEEVILRGSLVVYMIPLLAMLSGAVLAVSLASGNEDFIAIIGAVTGFALGIAIVRWHAWQHRSDTALQPSLLALLTSNTSTVDIS